MGGLDDKLSAYQVTTFGEGQLRLTVPSGERLSASTHLQISAAGSEANVAAMLSELSRRTAWASVIPQGSLGDRIVAEYRSTGIDTQHIVRTEEGRVALYFLEPGAGSIPAQVFYDREHTPFRDVHVKAFNLDALLDTEIIFLTGITAALSAQTQEFSKTIISEAKKRGVKVVFDVSFRMKLWSSERARIVLKTLLPGVDLLLCSNHDAQRVLNVKAERGHMARQIRHDTGVPAVVSSNGGNVVTVSARDLDKCFEVESVPVLDRPGAGDAFAAGIIDGYLEGDLVGGVRRGMMAAQYALTHYGDITRVTREDFRIRDRQTEGMPDIIR